MLLFCLAPVWAVLCGWLLLATLAAQYGVTYLEASRAAVIIVFELIAAVLSAAWPDQPQPALPRSAI